MSNTVTQLVDNFNLKTEVDWGLIGVIADAYRENGDELLADYLQSCCENKTTWETYLPEIYDFFFINSGYCKKIPPELEQFKRTMFWKKFLCVYVHSILAFMELEAINPNAVLPDYCLTLTSKMWPGYDCKGKTLGEIKEELSNV